MSPRRELDPGTVEARLSGRPEDIATLVSVLERISAGLPVTTISIDITYQSRPYPNRRDPGDRTYVQIRVRQDGGTS